MGRVPNEFHLSTILYHQLQSNTLNDPPAKNHYVQYDSYSILVEFKYLERSYPIFSISRNNTSYAAYDPSNNHRCLIKIMIFARFVPELIILDLVPW